MVILGNVRIGQAGDFVMSIKLGDEVITKFPFSYQARARQRSYNPQQRFVREGPWRDWGFISVAMDDSSPNIKFNFWISVRELPGGE